MSSVKYELTPEEIEILKAFHGHLGPYLVAGVRCGRYAIAKLNADTHFGIEADVQTPPAPPPSCFLDGIQISTGCTMGKMNLRHTVSEDIIAKFRNRKTEETLTVRLRPEAIVAAVEEMKLKNDVAGAAVIMQFTDEELLEELDN